MQQLKYSANKIKSFAESIVATMNLQINENERQLALLGMKCHNKASESFFPDISYEDGVAYDFIKQKQKMSRQFKERATSSKHAELFFECTDNCISLLPDEVEQFTLFIKETAALDIFDI